MTPEDSFVWCRPNEAISVQLLNYCNSVRILKWLCEISSVSAMWIYVAQIDFDQTKQKVV